MSVGKCDHKQLGYNVYIFIMILIIDIYYKIFLERSENVTLYATRWAQ